MNIVMNDAMAQANDMLPFSIGVSGTAGYSVGYSFWDGPVPDLNVVPNLDTVSTLSTLLTALGLDQSKFIGATNPSNLDPASTNWISVNQAGTVDIRNSRSVRNLVAQKSSSPTFCLMQYIPDIAQNNYMGGTSAAITWALFNANNMNLGDAGTSSNWGMVLAILTAGDEQSDAEIRLLGGAVVQGNSYRLSDFSIKIAPAYEKF